MIDTRTGKPFFKPYAIRRFQGKKVGFIGMTLEGTPGIVSPAGITHLKFADEADTANKYARVLQAQGRQGDRRADPPGRLPVRPVQHRHARHVHGLQR